MCVPCPPAQPAVLWPSPADPAWLALRLLPGPSLWSHPAASQAAAPRCSPAPANKQLQTAYISFILRRSLLTLYQIYSICMFNTAVLMTSLMQAVWPSVLNVLAWRWQQRTTESAHLVLLHHLPDSTAFLADDVAMQLVRHLHILRYGHQGLNEEDMTRLLMRKKTMKRKKQ